MLGSLTMALLLDVAVAAGLTPAPGAVGADEIRDEVARLRSRGVEQVVVVTEDEELLARLRDLMQESGAVILLAPLDSETHTIGEDGRCVILVRPKDGDRVVARLVGDCMGVRIPLSDPVEERMARLWPGEDVPLPEATLSIDTELLPRTPRQMRGKKIRSIGLVIAAAGAGLVGGTYTWYRLTDGSSDAMWAGMQAGNTVGWVLLAGGGVAAVQGHRMIGVDANRPPLGIGVGWRF